MDDAKPNRKGTFPRIVGGKASFLSRASFLSGATHAYFGPGQTPGTPRAYTAPDDWPEAGSLLRVPQVACLSALYYQLGQRNFLGRDYGFGFWEAVAPNGNAAIDQYIVQNAGMEEYDRMVGVFRGAKTRIEAIRKNRTYVIASDYVHVSDDDVTNDDISFSVSAGRWQYLTDGYLPIMAPSAAKASKAFMTDFLHVYIGHIYTGLVTGIGGGQSFKPLDDGVPLTDNSGAVASHEITPSLLDTDPYNVAKDRLVETYALFRRHATRLFSATGLDWTRGVSEETLVFSDGDGNTIPLHDVGRNTWISERNADRLREIADDLKDYGVTFDGDGTGFEVDDLVGIVADHFGFDPETGEDVH